MGIRGLTTFIARNSHKYLEPYELHDTYLVLDGNNIASHLYKWHCLKNDCFGGDYDKYAQIILEFFKLLQACNVIPIIIFDGGYEQRKLKTVYTRYKDKIKLAKNLNSVTQDSITMFPLFMREVFKDIILRLELKMVRCDFEADYEMACLARSLNCPILSYDSDFYIFDVLYIPFNSFEMSLHKLQNSSSYIRCSLYKVENFLRMYGGMDKTNLPLVAILLGNDYIKSGMFRNFYKHVKLPKRKHTRSNQQRKIVSVIKWLQNETYDSAVKKILGRLKTNQRRYIAKQIKTVTEGYICTNSKFLDLLQINRVEQPASELLIDAEDVLNNGDLESEVSSDEEDGSSDSSESSSGCNSLEEDISLMELFAEIKESEKSNKYNLPDWFINKFRNGDYPPCFMDIITKRMYFFPPQLENYASVCSHWGSIPLLSAINKILLSGNNEKLTFVARSENVSVKKYTAPTCDVKLPTLHEIPNINTEDAKKILAEILEIKLKDILFLDKLPNNYQLYTLGIIYWIKNASACVNLSHVYSIILCMLVLSTVDPQIGFFRSTAKFLNKFEKRLNSIKPPENAEDKNKSNNNFTTSNVTYNDSLLCMKDLIKYFQMDEKMKSNLKLFDVYIVDSFAQFQSCLLHITYLNALLNKPYNSFIISDFYDGTFLYNMCVNLMKRNDVDCYVNILLKNSTSILNCFRELVKMLIESLSPSIKNNAGKKRRKKRKKTVKEQVTDNEGYNEVESDEYDLVDVNNKFSVLRLKK